MTARNEILAEVVRTLAMAGFDVNGPEMVSNPMFDIIARRDSTLLLVKVLTNIDSMDDSRARLLKNIGRMLDATPLIIGVKTCSKKLEDGVVYTRYGVGIITPGTLYDYLIEGIPPLVFSLPGGYYVKIDGDMLREIRTKKGISLAALAEKIGVSVRTVQLYEQGMSPSVDVALSLEEVLGEGIAVPIDPFTPLYDENEDFEFDVSSLSDFQRAIINKLADVGYQIIPVAKCPFDSVGKGTRTKLVSGIRSTTRKTELKRAATTISIISRVAESDGVIFLSHRASDMPLSVKGMAIVGRNEIEDVTSEEEIIEIIRKRIYY